MPRFDEARQTLEQTLGQSPERGIYHFYDYELAFIRDDRDSMKKDMDWWAKRPTDTNPLEYQAGTAAFYVQWQKAQDFIHRSIETMRPAERFELGIVAGFWLTYLRGEIYLRLKAGNEAAAAFQKILRSSRHRAAVAFVPSGPPWTCPSCNLKVTPPKRGKNIRIFWPFGKTLIQTFRFCSRLKTNTRSSNKGVDC